MRWIRLTALFAVVSVCGTLAQAPAQAASFSVAVTGNRTVTPNTLTASPSTVSATVGDTISVSFGLTGAFAQLTIENGTGSVTSSGTSCTGFSCQVGPGGSATLTVVAEGTLTLSMAGTNTTLTIGTGGGGSSTASSGAPAPLVQEFGLPASGTCDAAASKDLNWAGVSSGGWSVSWGEWMNGGRGGAVCTRTLVYDTRAAAWAVAA